MTYDEFVRYLDQAGVALCLRGGEIVVQAPDAVLTAEFRALAQKYQRRLVSKLERETDGKSIEGAAFAGAQGGTPGAGGEVRPAA